jgi:hypothetical protein
MVGWLLFRRFCPTSRGGNSRENVGKAPDDDRSALNTPARLLASFAALHNRGRQSRRRLPCRQNVDTIVTKKGDREMACQKGGSVHAGLFGELALGGNRFPIEIMIGVLIADASADHVAFPTSVGLSCR